MDSAFARWLRECDEWVAYATGGMMTDDVDHDWARAFARGYAPKDLAKRLATALYNTT